MVREARYVTDKKFKLDCFAPLVLAMTNVEDVAQHICHCEHQRCEAIQKKVYLIK